MLSHEITSIVGSKKCRSRKGRGVGSGKGKTCGRGHKGAGSRSGYSTKAFFEGGQMPLFRRLPKRGFSNYNFAKRYQVVNVCQLQRFEDDVEVGKTELCKAGLIKGGGKVKILGNGQLTKKLQVCAHKFSRTAEQKISACGGSVKVI